MKAKQILKMYANGKRDFRGENLRGLSFKNQDLSGADFSDCDIRGTNFSGANLTGVRFINAKAGLVGIWEGTLFFICFFLAHLVGFFAIIPALSITLIYRYNLFSQINGCVALLTIILVLYKSIKPLTVIVGVILILALNLVLFFGYSFAVNVMENLEYSLTTFFMIIFVSLTQILTQSVGRALVQDGKCIVFASLSASIGGSTMIQAAMPEDIAEPLALALTLGINILNCYLGFRAIKVDPRDELIRTIALKFASIGATTFDQANLTDANFTEAVLKNANFKKAELIRTCFKDTKYLDLACW